MKRSTHLDPDRLFAAPDFGAFLRCHAGFLRGYLVWRLLSVLAIVPFPILTQRIVDVAVPARDLRAIGLYTAIAMALLLVHLLSVRRSVIVLSERVQILIRAMRARIFQKLQFMHFGFLDSTQLGRMLSKYAFDTHNIEAAAIPILTSVIPEVVRGILLIAALAWLDPWLLVFLVLTIPIFAWTRWVFFDRIKQWNREVRQAREQLTGQANEFISAIKLVRGFGQEPEVRDVMNDVSDVYARSRRGQMLVNQTMNYVIFAMFTGINILAVAFGAWLVLEGNLTIGTLMALVGALPSILNPINIFSQVSIQYFLGRESYGSIKELIDSGYVENWRGKHKLPQVRGEIRFEKVSFRYGPDKPLALRDVDLEIRAGEHVAFVGPSGSGKSSLVNLILGLYAPTLGRILIDGVPQEELAIRALRRQCAIVMQDNVLLSGTLLENLRFGRPEAPLGDVMEAARQANAWEFIEQLPDGLETPVGERGVSLSGGQRQRIAIARALLRNPGLLILDEATSALDYESEAVVQEALDRLARGRTTISIAHRLSTVRQANRIVVLDAGRVIETGSYSELAERHGSYFQTLLRAQG